MEYLPEPVALGADEPVGVDPDVVEEEGELPLGEGDRYRQRSRGQPGGVGVDDEQRQGRVAGALLGTGPGDDEDGVGLAVLAECLP